MVLRMKSGTKVEPAKLCGCRATAAATVFVDETVGGRGPEASARGAGGRRWQVRAAPVPRLSPRRSVPRDM